MNRLNVTKAGIEVKPGQVWRDMDERNALGTKRFGTVVSVHDGYATLQVAGAARTTRIAVRRMLPTSTGWELVSEAPAKETPP